MTKTVLYVFVFVSLLAAVAVLLAQVNRQRFRSRVTVEVGALFSDVHQSVGPEHLRSRWGALPEPVRRYFRFAVHDGAPAIRTARLRHDGFFRTRPDQRWLPIEGEQYFTTVKPGFVWHASVRLVPFLWIEARDHLLSGRGNMLVKLLSVFPIADASGAEIDQGSRLRWLAECAWFPYALVGDSIQWEPIDDRSTRVMLRDEGLPVRAAVEVDEEGKIVQLRAERYRDIGGGRAVLTPWIGRYGDYREFSGFCIPASVEVAWELERGLFSYARFRITALEYNVMERF